MTSRPAVRAGAAVRRWRGGAAAVATQLAGAGLLLTSGWLVVRAAEQPPVLYLLVAVVGVRFFGVARAGLRYLERLWTHDAALGAEVELRVAVHRQVERTAPRTLGGRRRGDVVARVVADVATTTDGRLRVQLPWRVAAGSTLVLVVVLAVVVGPSTGGVVLAQAVVTAALLRGWVRPRERRSAADTAALAGHLGATASEIVRTADDLVVLGATATAREAAGRDVAALQREQLRSAASAGTAQALVLVVTGLAMAAIAALTTGLDPVLVGVAVLAPLALAEPLDALADAERLRPGVEAAHRRLAELAAAPPAVTGRAAAQPFPQRHDLVLEGLVVGWTAPVCLPVTAALPEGSVTAVTGPSGAGKTTLALTLGRLLDPVDGTLLLGGVDVRELPEDRVRQVVGLIGQDDVVLDTSLRENLRIADPDADDEQLRAALRRAGAGPFLAGLQDGLDTELGESGHRISGGERRRVSIARALLGGHRVLVVDEPTEHLDGATADLLLDDLLALAPERTLVVASHAPRVLARIPRRLEVVPAGEREPQPV